MKYYLDLIGWRNSHPDPLERKVEPFLITIRKYSDLNGNVIDEWGNKKFDQAMFRLREIMLSSDEYLFLYDRENTPHTFTFGEKRSLSTFNETLPFNFTEKQLEDAMRLGSGDGENGYKFLIREIFPVENGIRFTYYILYPFVINLVNAMRRQLIDEFLEKN